MCVRAARVYFRGEILPIVFIYFLFFPFTYNNYSELLARSDTRRRYNIIIVIIVLRRSRFRRTRTPRDVDRFFRSDLTDFKQKRLRFFFFKFYLSVIDFHRIFTR